MPKSNELTMDELIEEAEKHFPDSYVVSQRNDFVFKKNKKTKYFFIETIELGEQSRWILLYYNPKKSCLYLFDPEGLPLYKCDSEWFTQSNVSQLHLCHSWFVSKFSPDERNKTGQICLELAYLIDKQMIDFQNIEVLETLPYLPSRIPRKLSASFGALTHFNFSDVTDSQDLVLFQHVEQYPAKKRVKTNAWEPSEFANLQLCRQKTVTTSSENMVVQPIPSSSMPDVVSDTTKPASCAKYPTFFTTPSSSQSNIFGLDLQTVAPYATALGVTSQDLERIDVFGYPEDQQEIQKLCSQLATSSNQAELLQKLGITIAEALNKIQFFVPFSLHG